MKYQKSRRFTIVSFLPKLLEMNVDVDAKQPNASSVLPQVFTEDQVGECQTNLKKVVCEKYTGTKPAECEAILAAGRPAAKAVTFA